MRSVRRRLPQGIWVWLALQAMALTALAPRDCCAGHAAVHGTGPGRADGHAAHAAADADDPSPPQAVRCPTHDGANAAPPEPLPPRCAMRGACDGPMASLGVLLSQTGVLPDVVNVFDAAPDTQLPAPPRAQPLNRLAPPDSPPPRV